MTKEVNNLIRDINNSRERWDEISQFTLKGVGNLSVSDLDTLELYAETYANNGGSFQGLMQPLGEIEQVLTAYGIKDKFSTGW